jgi:hypothetical protein
LWRPEEEVRIAEKTRKLTWLVMWFVETIQVKAFQISSINQPELRGVLCEIEISD